MENQFPLKDDGCPACTINIDLSQVPINQSVKVTPLMDGSTVLSIMPTSLVNSFSQNMTNTNSINR